MVISKVLLVSLRDNTAIPWRRSSALTAVSFPLIENRLQDRAFYIQSNWYASCQLEVASERDLIHQTWFPHS